MNALSEQSRSKYRSTTVINAGVVTIVRYIGADNSATGDLHLHLKLWRKKTADGGSKSTNLFDLY